MADHSKIEWTDATWNPVTGCTEVSPGCDRCYAKTFAERFRGAPGHYFENGFDVTFHSEDAAEARRVFDALSAGGKVTMPFEATFWSPGYGSLTDQFGIPWMVNTIPGPDWKPAAGG